MSNLANYYYCPRRNWKNSVEEWVGGCCVSSVPKFKQGVYFQTLSEILYRLIYRDWIPRGNRGVPVCISTSPISIGFGILVSTRRRNSWNHWLFSSFWGRRVQGSMSGRSGNDRTGYGDPFWLTRAVYWFDSLPLRCRRWLRWNGCFGGFKRDPGFRTMRIYLHCWIRWSF